MTEIMVLSINQFQYKTNIDDALSKVHENLIVLFWINCCYPIEKTAAF